MSLSHPNTPVSQQDLQDFYHKIVPYMGSGGGGGTDLEAYHTSDDTSSSLDDADKIPFYDTSASDSKNVLWSVIKSTLKTYFDTTYDLNNQDIPIYATSTTAASTAAKTATVQRGTFSLVSGAKVSVKFSNTNTDANPTLAIGNTNAATIKYITSIGSIGVPTKWWGAGDIVTFIYDGMYWIMQPTLGLTDTTVGLTTPELPSGNFSFSLSELKTFAGKTLLHHYTSNGTATTGCPNYENGAYHLLMTTCYTGVENNYNYWKGLQIDFCEKSESKGSGIVNTYIGIFIRYFVIGQTSQVVGWTDWTEITPGSASGLLSYSATERVVGTWINTKPIYQKTLTCTVPDKTTRTNNYSLTSLKIHDIVAVECSTRGTDLNTPIGYLGFSSGTSESYYNAVEVFANTDTLSVRSINYFSSGQTVYVTLRYTKTTD